MERSNDILATYVSDSTELKREDLTGRPDERRQFRRRLARWPSTLITQDKTVVHGRTLNVSELGALIASPYDFRIGALVVIEITIMYKSIRKPFRVRAEIRHSSIASDGFSLGVLFREISDVSRDFLKKYAEEKI
jgi:hypothetical protein